jgi:hypothetical protein
MRRYITSGREFLHSAAQSPGGPTHRLGRSGILAGKTLPARIPRAPDFSLTCIITSARALTARLIIHIDTGIKPCDLPLCSLRASLF